MAIDGPSNRPRRSSSTRPPRDPATAKRGTADRTIAKPSQQATSTVDQAASRHSGNGDAARAPQGPGAALRPPKGGATVVHLPPPPPDSKASRKIEADLPRRLDAALSFLKEGSSQPQKVVPRVFSAAEPAAKRQAAQRELTTPEWNAVARAFTGEADAPLKIAPGHARHYAELIGTLLGPQPDGAEGLQKRLATPIEPASTGVSVEARRAKHIAGFAANLGAVLADPANRQLLDAALRAGPPAP